MSKKKRKKQPKYENKNTVKNSEKCGFGVIEADGVNSNVTEKKAKRRSHPYLLHGETERICNAKYNVVRNRNTGRNRESERERENERERERERER